ncbi:MAG: SpoIIE family protein phosphatase [Prevotella sp.]|nr:SpoIIE family protein phosphatase [Prevotella sp.]
MKLKQDTKLSIMMVIAAALLLQMNETMEYFSTRRTFNEQLTEMAQYDLNDSHRISQVKQEVEAATQAILPKIAQQINEIDVDTLQMLVKNLITEQPQIVGISIGYLPEYVTKDIDFGNHRYGIYIYENHKAKEGVETVELRSKDYTERPWFEDRLNSNGYWSEPYEGLYNYVLMCSYSIPIRNDAGKTMAIMAADIPLREVSKAATKFYEMQRKSALRNFLFNLSGVLLLGFIVYRAFSYLRRLNTVYAEKERFTGELNVARNIQQSMIPKVFPQPSERRDLELFASLTPAREVGGDFYDFLILNDRVCFCIGDVSGKGVPASMLMTVTRTLFRTEARSAMHEQEESSDNDAAIIVERINHMLCEEQTSGFFVTMFVGMLDLKTGKLNYCNAGHEAPIVIHEDQKPLGIKSEGIDVVPNLPVGALSNWAYESQNAVLQQNDILFLYTDGLSEARNYEGDLLSRKRVLQLCQQMEIHSPEEVVTLMEKTVEKHTGIAEQSDDLTLMALKWKGHNEASQGPASSADAVAENADAGKKDDLQPTSYEGIAANADTVTLLASKSYLPQMKSFMIKATESAGLNERATKQLRLAVEEAVANVVHHSHADTVTLASEIRDNQLLLSIIDDGIPFDPTTAQVTDTAIPADKRPIGGLGIIFIRQMSDDLEYHRYNEHNILTIKKNIN